MYKKLGIILGLGLILASSLFFFTAKQNPIQKNAVIPKISSSIAPIKRCNDGYTLVPGNPFYKTPDFCVMKYDAKCSNPNPKCVTNEGVYDNAIPGCTCQENFQIVSTSSGSPVTFIPEISGDNTNAKNYCQNAGGHLITNPEWMTIARNAEQIQSNWCNMNGTGCGNAPGTTGKILANGHNDSIPYRALEASADGYPCFGTTSDSTNLCGGKSSQKRTLELSNESVIWDFAGNVWNWVDAEVERKDEPRSIVPGLGNSAWTWAEFQTVPYSDDFDPSNPKWNSAQGVGRIYHYNLQGDIDQTIYTYIRAGNWRHGYDSGAFTIHMQPIPSKTGIDDVGFRCVQSPD